MAINPVTHLAIIAALCGVGITATAHAAAKGSLPSLLDPKSANPPDRVRAFPGLACARHGDKRQFCQTGITVRTK